MAYKIDPCCPADHMLSKALVLAKKYHLESDRDMVG
jgi:hypothetical protein